LLHRSILTSQALKVLMASRNWAEETPANVAQMATTKNVLERSTIDVIGLFGPESRMSALIRTSTGSIRRVEIGDSLGLTGRIVAIDAQGVILSRNGENRRLTLPSG
jgi:hypothetical protein